MPRLNIYVSKRLRDDMAAFDRVLNWSFIASDAFKSAIDGLRKVNAVAKTPKKFGQTPKPRPVPGNLAEGMRRAKKKGKAPKGPPFRPGHNAAPEGEI